MKSERLVETAKAIALMPTQYLMGGYGCRLGLDWYNESFTWNKQNKALIDSKKNTDPITFGFDCVCLIKGILWGFGGYPTQEYGGAVYGSNGVTDMTIAQLQVTCPDLSTNFDNVEPGEFLFLGNNHVGIYIGNGEVIESTPAWKCCVQRTLLPSRNTTNYEKLPVRKWDMHGHSSLIEFPCSVDWKKAYVDISNKYTNLEMKIKKIKEVLTDA
ncbi:MAG: hypothetical protein J6U51_01570 [Bacteroidales bacterium]|nr:hypothetical protein [Bacteroidales bacterium]